MSEQQGAAFSAAAGRKGFREVTEVGWHLSQITKARATRFGCTITAISVLELNLLCADCSPPMKDQDFPDPTPEPHKYLCRTTTSDPRGTGPLSCHVLPLTEGGHTSTSPAPRGGCWRSFFFRSGAACILPGFSGHKPETKSQSRRSGAQAGRDRAGGLTQQLATLTGQTVGLFCTFPEGPQQAPLPWQTLLINTPSTGCSLPLGLLPNSHYAFGGPLIHNLHQNPLQWSALREIPGKTLRPSRDDLHIQGSSHRDLSKPVTTKASILGLQVLGLEYKCCWWLRS